jgi:hypothetical protein
VGSFFFRLAPYPSGCRHATAHALCARPALCKRPCSYYRRRAGRLLYHVCILSLNMIRSRLPAVLDHDDSGRACPNKVLACVPEQIIRAFLTTTALPPVLLRQPSPTPKSQNISPYTPYTQHPHPYSSRQCRRLSLSSESPLGDPQVLCRLPAGQLTRISTSTTTQSSSIASSSNAHPQPSN